MELRIEVSSFRAGIAWTVVALLLSGCHAARIRSPATRPAEESSKACSLMSEGDGRIISLRPLARTDGKPRFSTQFADTVFSFNPCVPFDGVHRHTQNKELLQAVLPNHDKDTTVVLGNSRSVLSPRHRVEFCDSPAWHPRPACPLNTTAGRQLDDYDDTDDDSMSSAMDEGDDDDDNDDMVSPLEITDYPDNVTGVLRFKSKGRCFGFRSFVLLQCDPEIYDPDEAQFRVIPVPCPGSLYFILRHRCCCEDLCSVDYLLEYNTAGDAPVVDDGAYLWERNDSTASESNSSTDVPDAEDTTAPKFMWLIVVVNIGVVGTAICIAGVCCRSGSRRSWNGPYGYLPVLHGSRLTIGSSMDSLYPSHPPAIPPTPPKSAKYLDYTSARTMSAKPPQLTDCVIPAVDLDIGQRLGGGVFGDTYLTDWKDRVVAAKRLSVGIHQGQLNETDNSWITAQTQQLSRLRHKNLVAVIGLCLETRQPHIITEHVQCESLKDQLIKRSEESFPWLRKIKICLQAAEGMNFLHTCLTPTLHRDLRCANILVDMYDKVKVVDYGVTKLVQRLRQGCSGRDGCYCQKNKSALPASIRWTSPELLRNTQADEEVDVVITPACDVYSFAMVLWEVASHCDPFEDIPDENEVADLVLDCVRPRVDILTTMISELRELMTDCWDDSPEQRPTFKHIAASLRTCAQVVTKMSSKSSRSRNNSSTHYLKSALNA